LAQLALYRRVARDWGGVRRTVGPRRLGSGVVHTKSYSRQGIDLSAVPRMDRADVVSASLYDLEREVVVSIPGASEESALQAVMAAKDELQSMTRVVELPNRSADAGRP
jgi:hypothetical protein